MSSARRVNVSSFAKVNLDLRVLHRRPDGFHEIRSLFHTISLADRMEIAFSEGQSLELRTKCPGVNLPEEENLAHRAARIFAEHVNLRGQLHISIEKKIPLGGGLGGGSTNAASVLLALPALTRMPIALPELLELAARLGSDVPFFMQGGSAIALGRGEELYPAPDFPSLFGLLVAPGIAVSTPEAYRSLARGTESAASARIMREFSSLFVAVAAAAAKWCSRWDGSNFGVNDFEAPVFLAHPSLLSWKSKLKSAGAIHAMMSGSGSSVFGLFRSGDAARKAAKQLQGGDVRIFRMLSRRRYQQIWHRSLHPYSDQLWPPHPQTA
jgi:4-diphosphocytidyl-2-C-methyl-D-erythritol kinase